MLRDVYSSHSKAPSQQGLKIHPLHGLNIEDQERVNCSSLALACTQSRVLTDGLWINSVIPGQPPHHQNANSGIICWRLFSKTSLCQIHYKPALLSLLRFSQIGSSEVGKLLFFPVPLHFEMIETLLPGKHTLFHLTVLIKKQRGKDLCHPPRQTNKM